MPHFDLVIIGAGPAGAAAAVTGRKAGLSVALIDKATFPRAKLCGGLITGRCARHMARVFGLAPDADLMEPRTRFEFHADGQPLGGIVDAPPVYLTMRWDFDHLLFRQALAAGAADFSGHRVEAFDFTAKTLTLKSGETLGWAALIGADGVQSIVAKALFGRAFDPAKIGFALEIEATSHDPTQATPLRVDFGAAAWGYGWSFAKRGSTTIGLGGLHARNPDMKARLAVYLDALNIRGTPKIKGHFLPFGDYRRHPGRRDVLLAGDAAGFVDPITGEGIGHAIHSGALAAQAAASALAEGTPQRSLAHYRKSASPIRTALFCARLLRPLIFSDRLKPFFKNAFSSSRTLKRDYLHLLAGDLEYPCLLSSTASRLPRAGFRWITRTRHDTGEPSSSGETP